MELLDCVKDAEKWDRLGFEDPHFTSAYYRAWKREGTLAVSHYCARPFIFQEEGVIGNAHNYGGTIFYDALGNIQKFDEEIGEWKYMQGFKERCIVFQPPKHHPIFGPARFNFIKPVVIIDLKHPYEFRQTTGHCIRKAKESGVITELVEPTIANTTIFENMYNKSMWDKNAAAHWHYYPGFFYQVLKEMGTARSGLFFTKVKGELETACLTISSPHICYYHWAARVGKNPKVGAGQYQIYTIANWAKWSRKVAMHLGGGVEPTDGLMRFKEGFSPVTQPTFHYSVS